MDVAFSRCVIGCGRTDVRLDMVEYLLILDRGSVDIIQCIIRASSESERVSGTY